MVNVHRIGQGKQQVDVEQKDFQGDSSRSWLTSSIVTIPASGWIGKSGRPCFLDTHALRDKDCLANSDNT